MRRIAIVAGVLVVALVGVVASSSAKGVNPGHLVEQGWDCFVPLPGDNVHCSRPGGLAGVLDGSARTMTFLVFETDDPAAEDAPFLGTELIVRADAFNGQPCPTDPPSKEYTYLLPLLGLDYYACHRYDSGF
jgi:hypothetical protein